MALPPRLHRLLLAALAFTLLALPAQSEPLRLRVVAANLSSGAHQSYDPGHGARMLQALKADIVLIQEFNQEKGAIRELVDRVQGPSAHFYREPVEGIPNGIISRYPITESGSWDDPVVGNRGFAWAKISLPGGKNLWAISLHLHSGGSEDEVRNTETVKLVASIKSKVPASDFLVLGGDFNTQVRGEPCLTTLGAVIVNTGPYPVDQSGDGDTNANRNKPYDWVLANPALQAYAVPIAIGARTYPGGFVLDTRAYRPISDIAPAQTGDSAAMNMQHMAVAREFLLP